MTCFKLFVTFINRKLPKWNWQSAKQNFKMMFAVINQCRCQIYAWKFSYFVLLYIAWYYLTDNKSIPLQQCTFVTYIILLNCSVESYWRNNIISKYHLDENEGIWRMRECWECGRGQKKVQLITKAYSCFIRVFQNTTNPI